MFRYIAKYNIHLGLAAAISGISYSILFHHYFDLQNFVKVFILQFFSVVAAYNYFRRRVKITWQLPLIIIGVISFYYSFNFQLLLFCVGLICFLYQLPIKNKVGFRFYPYLKPFIIGFCWTVILLLPIVENYFTIGNFDESVFVLFILKFLEISALCMANDLLHIPKDKVNGVKTFPIAYGINVTKISVLILSAFQFLFPLFIIFNSGKNSSNVELTTGYFLISMGFSYLLILASIILIHFKKNKGVEYLLDIIIGLEALLFLIINYREVMVYFNF